jgi:hypothetical protein
MYAVMITKKSKYGSSLKKYWIKQILAPLGLTRAQSDKSVQVYQTFKDYMSLEQCSRNEAVHFTAKFYRLSRPEMKQILSDFNQD